jgi:hypothetical protein
VIALWKRPLTLANGTKIHVLPSVNLRPLITDANGDLVEGDNSPDDFPPVGEAVITLADGSTVTVPYERAYYSMDLTTLARVKIQIGGGIGSTHDTLLSTIITDVSARMEAYMRRSVAKQTYTKTYPIGRLATQFRLDAFPVESITYIRYGDHPDNIDDAAYNLDATSYVLEDELTGLIRLHIETPLNTPRRPGYATVQWVGGMAEDVADLILLFPQIARAADMQVAYEFKRRHTPGGNVQTEGGSTGFDGEMDWLDNVLKTLNHFRRHVV